VDYSDVQILEVMHGLGITQAGIARAQLSARSLDALKSKVKRTYKALALKLHPDRTNNDVEKAKLFQLATHVVKEIESMEAHPNPRTVKWAVKIRSMSTT